jgi:hypothetical protein
MADEIHECHDSLPPEEVQQYPEIYEDYNLKMKEEEISQLN